MDTVLPSPPDNCTEDQLFGISPFVDAIAVVPNANSSRGGNNPSSVIRRCCSAGNITVHDSGCNFQCQFGSTAALQAFVRCNSFNGTTSVQYSKFDSGAYSMAPSSAIVLAVAGVWILSCMGLMRFGNSVF